MPRLDPDNHQINRPNFVHLGRSFYRIDQKIAVETFDFQPVDLDRAQVFAARDEGHVFAGLGKPAAEVTADAARSKDCYFHFRFPGFNSLVSL